MRLTYFSMFSGIGGFERGVQSVNRKKNSRVQKNPKRTHEEGQRLESPKGKRDSPQRGQNGKQPDLSPNNRTTCVGFSEVDKYASQIYKSHFKHKEYGDVRNIKWSDVEDFDLLVGGFPCQAFSIAGKRGGFQDTRGTLFFEIVRCLREKQPLLFLLENVKGLLSHKEGRTFGTILSTLDEVGYDLQWQVLNSKDYGVPQNRERVFIVGHLRGTSRPEVFPIRDYQGEDNRQTELRNRQELLEGSKLRSVQEEKKKTTGNSRGQIIRQEGNLTNHTNSRGRETHSHDYRIRRLTPTECERLQGFPDGWTKGVSDTQRYKCLGNAVTVNVIKEIMERLL